MLRLLRSILAPRNLGFTDMAASLVLPRPRGSKMTMSSGWRGAPSCYGAEILVQWSSMTQPRRSSTISSGYGYLGSGKGATHPEFLICRKARPPEGTLVGRKRSVRSGYELWQTIQSRRVMIIGWAAGGGTRKLGQLLAPPSGGGGGCGGVRRSKVTNSDRA